MGRLLCLQRPPRGRWGCVVLAGVVGRLGQHRTGVGRGRVGCVVVKGEVAGRGGGVCLGEACGQHVVWGKGW